MFWYCYNFCLFGVTVITFWKLADAQTKYACVTSSGLGNSGEYDSSSSEELFDSVSSPLGNSLGEVLVGHLTCIDRPNSLILVTKFIYGFGGFSKCAAPDAACDEEDFSDPMITPLCDGRPHCLVKVPARNLPKCGTLSNFVHVEYECVYSWSLYNICKDISSTVKGTEIYIASPNFFNNAVPPSKTCECIVQGRYDDQIMMQYAHTDILDDGNGQCKGNYFLVESKMANQSSVDKTTQVCGKRTTNNQLYRGTVRVTYTISSTARKTDGFLAKYMVPPAGPGGTNEIAVECGAVRSGPNSGPPQNQNPQQGPPQNNQGPQPGHVGPNQGPRQNYYPPHGMYPPHGPGMYPPPGPYPGPYQKSPRIPPAPQFNGQGGPNNQMNQMNRMGNGMNNQMQNTSSNGTNSMNNGPGNWNAGGNGPNQNFNGGLDPRMNRPGNQNRQFGGPQNPYIPKGMLRNVGPIRNLDKFSQGPPSLPVPVPPFNPFGMNGPPPKSWVPNLQGMNTWQNNQGQWQGNRGQNNGNWGGGGQGQGSNTNGQQGGPSNGGPQPSNPGSANSPKGVEFIGKIARKNPGGNGGAPSGGGGGGGGSQTPSPQSQGNAAPPPPPLDPGGVAPVVGNRRDTKKSSSSSHSDNVGQNVAYIVGITGAVLTAGCGLFIALYCSRRRRIKRSKDSSRANETIETDDDPVYTGPSAFDYAHPSARSCVARVNSAYEESDAGSVGDASQLSISVENFKIEKCDNEDDDDDDYQTVGDVEVERSRSRDTQEEHTHAPKTSRGFERSSSRTEAIYDNNIQNC